MAEYHDSEEAAVCAAMRHGLWIEAAMAMLKLKGELVPAIKTADSLLANFDHRFPEVAKAADAESWGVPEKDEEDG